jgi:hypothetical protein
MTSTPVEVGTLIVVILKAASYIASQRRFIVSPHVPRKISPIKDILESKIPIVL